MTENEKIEYAKSYIDKLANGINPLDNTPVSDESILNNPRIIRCLFYVSDVLRRTLDERTYPIEMFESEPAQKQKRLAYHIVITDEIRMKLKPYSYAVYGGMITKLINSVLSDYGQKLKVTTLNRWLIKTGHITKDEETQIRKYAVTEDGRSLGLYEESYVNGYGERIGVMFAPEAQQFILDNIDAIADFQNETSEKRTPERSLYKWEKEEEELLVRLHKEGKNNYQIGRELKRTTSAVRMRLAMLGVK